MFCLRVCFHFPPPGLVMAALNNTGPPGGRDLIILTYNVKETTGRRWAKPGRSGEQESLREFEVDELLREKNKTQRHTQVKKDKVISANSPQRNTCCICTVESRAHSDIVSWSKVGICLSLKGQLYYYVEANTRSTFTGLLYLRILTETTTILTEKCSVFLCIIISNHTR